MKSLFKKENIVFMLAMFGAVFLMAEPAFAAGGTNNVTTIFETIKTILQSVSVVTITIAFIFAGYKIAFGGSTLRDCAPILIGGILVGAAAWLAGQIVG